MPTKIMCQTKNKQIEEKSARERKEKKKLIDAIQIIHKSGRGRVFAERKEHGKIKSSREGKINQTEKDAEPNKHQRSRC